MKSTESVSTNKSLPWKCDIIDSGGQECWAIVVGRGERRSRHQIKIESTNCHILGKQKLMLCLDVNIFVFFTIICESIKKIEDVAKHDLHI